MIFNEAELNMKSLFGKTIDVEGICKLKPKTINEIDAIGFEKYNQYLSMLCITSYDIYELLDMNDKFENVEPFEFILSNCVYSEDFLKNTIDALYFFIEEEIIFHLPERDGDNMFFYMGDINDGRFIHVGNFNFLIDILKMQNCISENTSNRNRKPKNEAEKDLYRQLNKARSKYNKKDSDMTDIISSICAKHPSINLFNVGSLTIYQMIDQYKRLNAIDEYFISIDSLLHGASSDDVKVTHWSSKQQQT